jgi:hypothetical protein
MKNCRKGENGKTWFRNERFFTLGADWYATTREHINLGPFKNKFAAEQALVRYIIDLKNNRKPANYSTKASSDVWMANNRVI